MYPPQADNAQGPCCKPIQNAQRAQPANLEKDNGK